MDQLSLHFVKFSLQIAKLQGETSWDLTASSAMESVSATYRQVLVGLVMIDGAPGHGRSHVRAKLARKA